MSISNGDELTLYSSICDLQSTVAINDAGILLLTSGHDTTLIQKHLTVNDTTTSAETKLGNCGIADTATFAHKDFFTPTGYGVSQSSTGMSKINSVDCIKFSINDNDKMMLNSSGFVGIGTTNPQAPLHISNSTAGTINAGASNGGTLYAWDSATAFTWSDLAADTSMYVAGNIVATSIHIGSEITFSSDSRIKHTIEDIDDTYALTKLRALRPKTYHYIDKLKGENKVIGYIAQDIENDLPDAHKIGSSKIPNIYQVASLTNKTLTFDNPIVLEKDENGEIYPLLSIMGWDRVEQYVSISSQVDAHTIKFKGKVDKIDRNSKVFVYGQTVSNFHQIKKEYIFTIATAALQEVDKIQQAEKLKTATLEAQISEQSAAISSLTTQLSSLGTTVASLVQEVQELQVALESAKLGSKDAAKVAKIEAKLALDLAKIEAKSALDLAKFEAKSTSDEKHK
jgi:hypothetical protein